MTSCAFERHGSFGWIAGYVEVSGPGRRGLPRANALERGRDARARRREAGASPHGEGTYHRAAPGGQNGPEDAFLLVTDSSDLAGPVADSLRAARFASRCEIEIRPWVGFVQLGSEPEAPAVAIPDFGVEAWEAWREQAEDGADADGARAPADRGRNSRLGQGARRVGPARRGGARRDAHLVHEGLLPRARSRSPGSGIAGT